MSLRLKLPVLRFENPVLVKELRTRMRGAKAYWVLFMYLALVSLVYLGVYAAWAASAASAEPSPSVYLLGRSLFTALWITQLVLVVLIVPALTSGMLTIEREQKTYELLCATTLRPRTIVVGKLFSALVFVLLLLFASLPFASVTFFTGGVSPGEVFTTYLILFAVAFMLGSCGILSTSVLQRTAGSIFVTYGVIVILYFIFSTLVAIPWMMRVQTLMAGGSPSMGAALSPSIVFGSVQLGGVAIPSWLLYVAYSGLLGSLLIVLAVQKLPNFSEDKSLAIRILALLSYLYTFGLGASAVIGSPAVGVPGTTAVMIGVFFAMFAGVLLVVPVFVTTAAMGAAGLRGMLAYLASGIDPRKWFKGELRGGFLYLALWPILGCVMLWAIFRASGQPLSERDVRVLSVDCLMCLGFIFAVSSCGLLLSLLLRNKSRAAALTYFVFAMAVFLPLIPVVWADYTGSFNLLYNLLYLNPFYALIVQLGLHDASFAQQMLFFGMHPWKVTTILYAAAGLIGLGFSFLAWPRVVRTAPPTELAATSPRPSG